MVVFLIKFLEVVLFYVRFDLGGVLGMLGVVVYYWEGFVILVVLWVVGFLVLKVEFVSF